MHNLYNLGQVRFKHLIKEIGKYSRLIINDHFSIILLVLLAFGGFYYQNLLAKVQTLDLGQVKGPVVLVSTLFLSFLFQLGRPIWFTQEADKAYLFPQGEAWYGYWLRWTLVSLILPLLVLISGGLMVYPFLKLVTAWADHSVYLFLGLLSLLKLVDYLMLYLSIFDLGLAYKKKQFTRLAYTLVFAGILLVSSFMPTTWDWMTLFTPSVLSLAYFIWAYNHKKYYPIEFDYVVEEDQTREASFYRWVSVFADVPNQVPAIKRRSYLDRLIRSLSGDGGNRFYPLYLRLLVRNTAFSGIWLKITIFVGFLLFFVSSPFLVFCLGALGYLMTVLQLVAMIHVYDHHPLQKIYPMGMTGQLQAFQKTLSWVFLFQSLVFTLIYFLSHWGDWAHLWLIPAWLAFAATLIYIYVPWWNRKHV